MPDFHTFWRFHAGQTGGMGDAQALFPYWSYTKTVIATCVLQLVEKGQLDLAWHPDGMSCSLQQLLSHTAGLPDYSTLADYQADVAQSKPAWPRDHLVQRCLKDGRLLSFGAGWAYSNLGYLFLREVLQQATGLSLAEVIHRQICAPLGLRSVRLAQSQEDFDQLYWDEAKCYDPAWVYHGCLIGTAPEAVRLHHAVMTGGLLRPSSQNMMFDTLELGGPIEGRPWAKCGYGLGVMSGVVAGLGRAIGHSGSGPFSVNLITHFPDLRTPLTIGCFADGHSEAVVENEAVRVARDLLHSV